MTSQKLALPPAIAAASLPTLFRAVPWYAPYRHLLGSWPPLCRWLSSHRDPPQFDNDVTMPSPRWPRLRLLNRSAKAGASGGAGRKSGSDAVKPDRSPTMQTYQKQKSSLGHQRRQA